MNKTEKKKKLKRVILITVFTFAGIGFIYLILLGVSELLLKDDNNSEQSGEISFFTPDYSENIYENENYMSKNRNIYYLQYGSGEPITEENFDSMPLSARFFYEYFEGVKNGNYVNHSSFFTEKYQKNNTLSETFTMQKIYDIEVDLFEKRFEEEGNDRITVETYIVEYKIMENNGTFRNDVGSNTLKPLVYTLHIKGEKVLIDSISEKKTKS